MHFFINYFYLIATFLEPCVMRNTKLKHNGQMCPSRPDLALYGPRATSGPLAVLDRSTWSNWWIKSQSQICVIRCTQYNCTAFIFKYASRKKKTIYKINLYM